MKERLEKRLIEKNKVIIEKISQNYSFQWEKTDIRGLTKNLSSRGAAILTNINLPINVIIIITLELSSSNENIKVQAKVKWVKPVKGEYSYEVGLNFGHDSPDTFMALQKHLSEKVSKKT